MIVVLETLPPDTLIEIIQHDESILDGLIQLIGSQGVSVEGHEEVLKAFTKALILNISGEGQECLLKSH